MNQPEQIKAKPHPNRYKFTAKDVKAGGQAGKGKSKLSATARGRAFVNKVVENREPAALADLINKYTLLREGVTLPDDIGFEIHKFIVEQEVKNLHLLELEQRKEESSINQMRLKEDADNRKLVLKKKLHDFNSEQIDQVYQNTIAEMRDEIKKELIKEYQLEDDFFHE